MIGQGSLSRGDELMTETSNQRRIRELLDEKEPEKDRSLRAQALTRATEAKVPKTLTPWEWEQWYTEHGKPESHRASPEPRQGLWQRWFGSRNSPPATRNCARLPDEDSDF